MSTLLKCGSTKSAAVDGTFHILNVRKVYVPSPFLPGFCVQFDMDCLSDHVEDVITDSLSVNKARDWIETIGVEGRDEGRYDTVQISIGSVTIK